MATYDSLSERTNEVSQLYASQAGLIDETMRKLPAGHDLDRTTVPSHVHSSKDGLKSLFRCFAAFDKRNSMRSAR
jgi:hypothetical protein